MVRYEDLIASPGQAFGEVCDFLGLNRSDNVGADVHAGSQYKWRDDPHFTLQLDESVVRLAGHFGYSDDDLYNPLKPGMTPAKKMLKRTVNKLRHTTGLTYNRFIKSMLLSTLRRK